VCHPKHSPSADQSHEGRQEVAVSYLLLSPARSRSSVLAPLGLLLLTACGANFSLTESDGVAGSPNTNTTADANSRHQEPGPDGTDAGLPPATDFLVDAHFSTYARGAPNALGALRGDGGTMDAVIAGDAGLTLRVPTTQTVPAYWFEAFDAAHFNIASYSAIEVHVTVPAGSTLQLSLVGSATDANAVIAASTKQIPYNQVTGAPTVWRLPLAQFGLVNLTDVRGLRFDGFAPGTSTVLSQVAVVGLAGVDIEPAPLAATARLELPDVNMGGAGAQWVYDDYTYVGPVALGPTGSRNAADVAIVNTLVQPAGGRFRGATGITGRPYAVSGQTTNPGAGDRIKLRTAQSFDGPHTYNARVYLPLAQNNQGGEKWVTAYFLLCTSCTPDANGYKPEIDVECHYGDKIYGTTSMRQTVGATPSQVVCQMHIQDGSPDGYAGVPVAVEGDAWHEFKIATSDTANSGYYTIAMGIDGQAIQWPGGANGANVTAVDTGSSDWTAKSVLYQRSATPLDVLLSLEHANWGGSQLSTDYQSAYFDWVTVD
jgi:hypothetical protein